MSGRDVFLDGVQMMCRQTLRNRHRFSLTGHGLFQWLGCAAIVFSVLLPLIHRHDPYGSSLGTCSSSCPTPPRSTSALHDHGADSQCQTETDDHTEPDSHTPKAPNHDPDRCPICHLILQVRESGFLALLSEPAFELIDIEQEPQPIRVDVVRSIFDQHAPRSVRGPPWFTV